MAVKTLHRYVGPRTTPQEIRDLRQSSLDFHRTMGMPVIHKHRWNFRDFQEGRVQRCPLHDEQYGSADYSYDEICFGTGFVGGFADGMLTYVTIADSSEDTVRIGPGGTLIAHTTPGFTAPWTPDMGDGDLLITGDFNNELELTYPRERYLLGQVDTVTMRGFQRQVQTREFVINQAGQLTKLPWEHVFYNVPLVFDPNIVPPDPVVPPGGDPDDYPEGVGTYTESSRVVMVIGQGAMLSVTERAAKVTGLGSTAESSADVRVEGEASGIVWNW